VKNVIQTVLPFPCASGASGRRDLQKRLSQALRVSEFPVVIDLSECRTLDHQDVDTLLNCVAQGVGCDTQVFFVAGSPTIRVLLEVTRIASLVPVFDSMEEALAHPSRGYSKTAAVETIGEAPSQLRRSA
jgi:anti-anti-sigma regulatory factor